jgi:hypothetical protein
VMDAYTESEKLTRARRRRFVIRLTIGVALVLGVPVSGQSGYPQFPSSSNNGRYGQHYPDSGGQFGQDSNSPDKKRMRMLNTERQKALISDTEKLLKLAKELNDEVTESDSTSMNDAEMRKVAEIGKLAHSVKEKMSYSVGGFPATNPPLTNAPGVQ